MTERDRPEWGDAELTEAFRGLRDEVRAGTPSFAQAVRRAVKRPAPGRPILWRVAAMISLVIGGTGLWFLQRERTPSLPAAFAVTRWEGPTDFLLDTPTRAMLGTVPSVGQSGIPPYDMIDDPPLIPDTSPERGI